MPNEGRMLYNPVAQQPFSYNKSRNKANRLSLKSITDNILLPSVRPSSRFTAFVSERITRTDDLLLAEGDRR